MNIFSKLSISKQGKEANLDAFHCPSDLYSQRYAALNFSLAKENPMTSGFVSTNMAPRADFAENARNEQREAHED